MLSSSSGEKGIASSVTSGSRFCGHRYFPWELTLDKHIEVFVGTTAAISFLQFLQKTLKHYVGPSGFTDEQHSRKLFEAAASDDDVDSLDDDLDGRDIPALIQCFLEVVSSGLCQVT